MISLSLAIHSNHHLSEQPEHNDWEVLNTFDFIKDKVTGDNVPTSNVCTTAEQRKTADICQVQNSKCWGWCKDKKIMVDSSAESEGKWCYVKSDPCKEDIQC